MNEIEFKGCMPVLVASNHPQLNCDGCEFLPDNTGLCDASQKVLKCTDPDIIWIKKDKVKTDASI
jgi:hypothetical protein